MMTAHWKTALGILLLGWLCLCSTVPAAAQGHNVDVALVADPDIPVSNLTLAEVRKVFRGERQYWNTNLAVVLLRQGMIMIVWTTRLSCFLSNRRESR